MEYKYKQTSNNNYWSWLGLLTETNDYNKFVMQPQ